VLKLRDNVESQYIKNNTLGLKHYPGTPERDVMDKIIYNVHNIDKIFVDILSTEFIKFLAIKFLNDPYYRFLPVHVPNYILLYYNARSSGNALDLHIDSNIPFIGGRPNMMQFVILLEDSTEQNGCTVVVPGSHLSGQFSNRGLKNVTPLTGKAGDLIFWDSRLWHGTLKNNLGLSRWALVATLGMWWIKPSIDIPRGIKNEIYEKLSDEQKQMLGFCAIPPIDPMDRINTKCGYDFLKKSIGDYRF
jgi:hypothetical protein